MRILIQYIINSTDIKKVENLHDNSYAIYPEGASIQVQQEHMRLDIF